MALSPLLSVKNLSVQIETMDEIITPVDSVSFDLYPGEIFALLGESGCGKSMTALALSRLLPIQAKFLKGSEIWLNDIPLHELSESQMQNIRGAKIGMVFQDPALALNPVFTVGDQLKEAIKKSHDLKNNQEIKKMMVGLLEQVRIPDPLHCLKQYPHQLSGGMKQRIVIAMALSNSPDLLIADEPTTNLDVTTQAQVLDLLKHLNQTQRMGIILITHDFGVVAQMADTVSVMYAGHIVESSTKEIFLTQSKHPYTKKLFQALPDDARGRLLTTLPGRVPALNQVFKLCRFKSRCSQVFKPCELVAPRLVETRDAHAVRCHWYDPCIVDTLPESLNIEAILKEEAKEKAVIAFVHEKNKLTVENLLYPMVNRVEEDKVLRSMVNRVEEDKVLRSMVNRVEEDKVLCSMVNKVEEDKSLYPMVNRIEKEKILDHFEKVVDKTKQLEFLSEVVLCVENLKVHFPISRGIFKKTVGHIKSVDGISFVLKERETLALVGESGCGKTTTAKAILRLIREGNGRVEFQGVNLLSLPERKLRLLRTDIQMVFQDPYSSMDPRFTVKAVIEEGMKALKVGANISERHDRILHVMDCVGLSSVLLNRYPHQLSGGQRQRVAIARALALGAQVIICDEPTSALDLSVQAQILNLLSEIQEEFDVSYLFITHNISVVNYLAHAIAIMYLGHIVETGGAEAVIADPKHPYTQALMCCVPSVTQRTLPIVIKGEVPSLSHLPKGCHFAPRCPKVHARCLEAYPPTYSVGEGRTAACYLYADD